MAGSKTPADHHSRLEETENEILTRPEIGHPARSGGGGKMPVIKSPNQIVDPIGGDDRIGIGREDGVAGSGGETRPPGRAAAFGAFRDNSQTEFFGKFFSLADSAVGGSVVDNNNLEGQGSGLLT
ncbi:MAG: hypothetical protein UX91_C0007G0067 [Candidatus Amesbacteria bacterium GW2011_GWB1_47_19]|nr:MAG: hypothetical protein UW51_C0006G0112 [Candidatus Amesbacteria bacterium GW2011_GWA1_44_24]KKU31851.1 MAG: hypothetical protein UX46_C0002G0067 [Candidatus Amesbacteria bacterium GW2011_GWC1_46_24]KKU66787.1 MAG: hypothetical protein UX91_C0007G0067 [Candidatus Amesbacteria bacterium GW2011_GWB1_47_19]